MLTNFFIIFHRFDSDMISIWRSIYFKKSLKTHKKNRRASKIISATAVHVLIFRYICRLSNICGRISKQKALFMYNAHCSLLEGLYVHSLYNSRTHLVFWMLKMLLSMFHAKKHVERNDLTQLGAHNITEWLTHLFHTIFCLFVSFFSWFIIVIGIV